MAEPRKQTESAIERRRQVREHVRRQLIVIRDWNTVKGIERP